METERKFVVDRGLYEKFLQNHKPEKYVKISQFYIPALNGTFRLRRSMNENFQFSYFVTLKKYISDGVNEEIEVNIDSNTAYEILNAVKGITGVIKVRRVFNINDKRWEIDSFEGGVDLTLAEVELDNLNEDIILPVFIDEEVTGNKDFSNESISSKLAT